jgi:hypothetical protein
MVGILEMLTGVPARVFDRDGDFFGFLTRRFWLLNANAVEPLKQQQN